MYNINGLNEQEVIKYRKENGTNEITRYKKNTIISFIIDSLNDPIIKILLIALGIKMVFLFNDSDIYETIGIIMAIIIASLISSLSEYASEKAFLKLSLDNTKSDIKVFRNKKLKYIDINDVVVNDYIFLESGDKIPADGMLYQGNLSVDESMISGETKEVHKKNNDFMYRGSVITDSNGVMKVTKVGNNTFYGKIAKDIQEKSPDSPLKNRLNVLAKFVSKIGYICALLVILSYLFNEIVISNNFEIDLIIQTINNPKEITGLLLYALTIGVTIIVVAVPEGLPMMITLVLSSNMKKLLKNNVLVRKLSGIEASGSLNILFTDKTGTITKGKLEMKSFVLSNNKVINKIDSINNNKLKELITLSLVYNNEATYSNKDIIGGNSTDKAILKYMGNNYTKEAYKVLNKTSFSSLIKYSSITLNYNKITTFYKGAYELIINKCMFKYNEDYSKEIIHNKDKLLNIAKDYTLKGFRVLACACKNDKDFNNLTFIGFTLIKDEIRKEAKEGIKLVSDAGVQTVMITGDSLETATIIAKEAGLLKNKNDVLITHDLLTKLNDEEVKKIIPNLKVIARSLPEDKKRLVLLSRELGLVVGMSGDGVNDAPALKQADVGFSMGSGSEVSKEVSDIIILDDNYMSIAKTILFGRSIFKSIRKFIIFQLSVNLSAVFISIIGPLFGVSSPVTAIQMLWINMIMDTLAGIAYAYEPALLSYMQEQPKKKDEKIMNSYMINEILITGTYISLLCMYFLKSNFIKSLYRDAPTNKFHMSAFFGLFIFINIFNAFNARSDRLNIFANLLKNKVFLAIISLVIITQVVIIYYGGAIFRTTGLSIFEFEIMLILSLSVIPFDFIRKIILKKLSKTTSFL